MVDFTKLNSFKNAVRGGVVARVVAAMVGGSLNQKVIILIGLVAAAYSLYIMLTVLWQPLIIGSVGSVIVALAVKDFEKAPPGPRT